MTTFDENSEILASDRREEGSQYIRAAHRMFTAICLLILSMFMFCAITPMSVFAVSFDCAKATHDVEKMICSDKELSALDDELALVYKKAFDRAKDKQSLQVLQKRWIRSMRKWVKSPFDSCRNEECVKIYYKQRLKWLAEYSDVSAIDIPAYVPGKYINRHGLCCNSNIPDKNKQAEDKMEIVLLTKRLAFVKMDFVSAYGNVCEFSGYGTWNGKNLSLQEEETDMPRQNCTIELKFEGLKVKTKTIGEDCSYYCGLNASLNENTLTKLKSRKK